MTLDEIRVPRLLNSYGKPWDASDALYLEAPARALAGDCCFSVTSTDGVPLFGCYVDGRTPVSLVAKDWAMREHGPMEINPLTKRPYDDA